MDSKFQSSEAHHNEAGPDHVVLSPRDEEKGNRMIIMEQQGGSQERKTERDKKAKNPEHD